MSLYHYMQKKTFQEHGSAIFLIFIAIALFAAISYAVTQSTRGSGDIDREQAEVVAARLVQHMSLIRNAVQNIMLLNGCTDNEIAFYDPSGLNIGAYAFPTIDAASIKPECNVYDQEGGGLQSMMVPTEVERIDDIMQPTHDNEPAKDTWSRSFLPLRGYVRGVGRDYQNGSDYTASEIVLAVQMRSREVCLALNKGLDVTNPGGEPPTNAGIPGGFMSGNCEIEESRSCNVLYRSNNIPELDGLEAVCFYNPNNSSWVLGPRYSFYMVMVPG